MTRPDPFNLVLWCIAIPLYLAVSWWVVFRLGGDDVSARAAVCRFLMTPGEAWMRLVARFFRARIEVNETDAERVRVAIGIADDGSHMRVEITPGRFHLSTTDAEAFWGDFGRAVAEMKRRRTRGCDA